MALGKVVNRFWWVLPLLLFDFLYYYFIRYLVERGSEGATVELHGEALFFTFLINEAFNTKKVNAFSRIHRCFQAAL